MKIVSGGQTGVDRAALDVAIELGYPHGGWVPKGRAAEDGPIPPIYQMTETPDADRDQRTKWNIRDSDATLILTKGDLTGGTALTWNEANGTKKPVLIISLLNDNSEQNVDRALDWLSRIRPQVLNVAGPKESEGEAYLIARDFLRVVLGSIEFDDASKFVFDQAYANFRHWDQIRWLVPYWLATIAAGTFAVFATNPVKQPYPSIGFSGLAIFSILCLLLMLNLIRYHRKQIDGIHNLVRYLRIASVIKAEMRKELPFSFGNTTFVWTATFWFMFAISFITGISIVEAIWWKP